MKHFSKIQHGKSREQFKNLLFPQPPCLFTRLSNTHNRCSKEVTDVDVEVDGVYERRPKPCPHLEITLQQRWSPRGHGLGLEDPRGQLTMSLALALGSKSLVLALALDCQSLALALASEVVLDVGLEH